MLASSAPLVKYTELGDVPRGASIQYRKDPSSPYCSGIFLEPYGVGAKILTQEQKITIIPKEDLL
jgi:hypothetical protein